MNSLSVIRVRKLEIAIWRESEFQYPIKKKMPFLHKILLLDDFSYFFICKVIRGTMVLGHIFDNLRGYFSHIAKLRIFL